MIHPFKILFLGIMLFVFSTIFVLAQDQYISPEELMPLLNEIDQLNQKLEQLEKDTASEEMPEDSQQLLNYLKQDMEELNDILERAEKKSLVDKLHINSEIRTRMDWYSFRGHDQSQGKNLHERVHMQPSNRFRLNLRASISDNTKFTSRLTMFRHWSDDDLNVYPDINFLNTTRVSGDVTLKVERAYVDVFLNAESRLPMAITFGRLPSTDGFPTELRENTPRKSTYPAMAYNVESDGIGLSLDLEPLTHISRAAARFVVAIRYDDHEQHFLGMGKQLTDTRGIYRVDEKGMKPIHFSVFQLEGYFPGVFGGLQAIFNILHVPKASRPDLRYEETLTAFYDDDPLLFTRGDDSLGNFTKYSLFLECKKIMGFNLDWFAGVSYLKTHATSATEFMLDPRELALSVDDQEQYQEPVSAKEAYHLFQDYLEAHEINALKYAPYPIGLLNNDGQSDHDAHCVYMGGRLKLPFSKSFCPLLGVEYNHGSRYWLGLGDASEDPLQKLATRGEVWDFYLLQPVTRHLIFRLGHTVTRHDYDQSLSFYYGEPLDVDHKITNTYVLVDARF